ncbi:MAG: glucose-6-phosphate isomerase [Synergistaceae bacterium]|jgi:glucose-6-phosphate isomerase|nr:glucose-6-phosphate isomerase [Synergistaceae bacterium]
MSALGISFSFGCAAGREKWFGNRLDAMEAPCAEAVVWLTRGAQAGDSGFGWYGLTEQELSPILDAAKWLSGYEAIIHVGIGGSALGNLMLHQALLPMYFNEKPGGPKFYLADNPDPDKASAIWEMTKGKKTALIGVSKSGSTAETMSQFLWFRSKLEEAQEKKVDGDILVITDPKDGVFRSFTKATGCRSLEVPPTVGGRYSVLTACGLVTAAALGADIKELIAGAAGMKDFLGERAGLRENPALYLASANYLHLISGRPMTVLMPYSNKLETFSEWFAQLWGESVGKDGTGSTPIRTLGAIDQHSQVQLYTAGPDDKLYTIINVVNREHEISLPKVSDESLSSLAYLSGQRLGGMLGYEAASTAAALVKADRPVVWIELDRLNAKTLGGLIFFFEYMTAVCGRLMRINPFDQPGVEQGKRYTYGMMGRTSYKADAEEATELFKRVKKNSIQS